ncbi:MAG: potassium channel family protein [Bacteroidota bacterium]
MHKKAKNFARTLVMGKIKDSKQLKPALNKHWYNTQRIWRNIHYKDFGIERIIRLFLAFSLFLFPGLYVKHFSGKLGLIPRKLSVELYVIFKFLLPLLFFKLHLTSNIIVVYITIYFTIETVLYLASMIYLSDIMGNPITYRRSLTMLFINYVEIGLGYSVVYYYLNATIIGFFNVKLVSALQAIYFSFTTSATIGFGDIHPLTNLGRILVLTQVALFFIFVGLFLNFYSSKVHEVSYFNEHHNKD